MSILKELNNDINTIINKAGYEAENIVLLPSNRKDLGAYQLNCAMSLAKTYHKSPMLIAQDIKEELEKSSRFVNVNVASPGFINLSLSKEYLVSVLNEINSSIYNNIDKEEKKKIIIDYGGANVSKALHVGHLRSANIGEALKRLAKLVGYEVLGDAHLGDYGRPLGLVILEIKKRYPYLAYFNTDYKGNYEEVTLPITNKDLEEIYPYASTKSKEDEEYLEEAREITFKIQNHEGGYYDLWKKIVSISKEDIKSVYDELNVSFDLWLGESDAMEYFEELKDIFTKKNLLKDSDGAQIVEVANENDKSPMPPLLFIKSNKAISYATTDLATILQREKNYHPDEIWYCVDSRQNLHFEQVFRAARLANLVREDVKLSFIGFGTMNGKDGKPFKTRDGGIMTLKNLIKIINAETMKRLNTNIEDEKERESISKTVAIAALKYADFLPFRTTDYIFEEEKFSDLEGKTGPYLLYSTIRMKSLLDKASSISYQKISLLETPEEEELALNILNLPTVISKSLEAKSLNEICEYLYNITSLYNKFYSENRILTEKNNELKESRLVLTKIIYELNILLLDVLGIKVPKKM